MSLKDLINISKWVIFFGLFYIYQSSIVMLHKNLLKPSSIAVIGGSDHIDHLGGSVLKNLLDQEFKGDLYVVNLKKDEVQGVKSYRDASLLPQTDLAIIAIPAQEIWPVIKELIKSKGTRGFIIFSSGFGELNKEGRELERKITTLINSAGGSLLGPNNIGMINHHYAGIFTRPLPVIDKKGVSFISGSGATAVFTLEAAQQIGLRFSNIFTVGNSAQLGAEDILEHLDDTFRQGESSHVIMLYLESVKNASKLLEHAISLRRKGCSIVALKSGVTDKGNAAAASHTGAMVNSDLFVQALFKKAGIIRCYSRYELITIAAILQATQQKPKRFAVVTHAGGPGVILTDTLTQNGLSVPDLSVAHQNTLKKLLYPGSATANPIDILATGTADQLEKVLDYCERDVKEIDAVIVIFGSPGLGTVTEAYKVIHQMAQRSSKPVFAILPSVVNVKEEISSFIKKGNLAFNDEYLFGTCLAKVMENTLPPRQLFKIKPKQYSNIRTLAREFPNGFLQAEQVYRILQAAGIGCAQQQVVSTETELLKISGSLNYPVVQKVVGPLHKSDIKGVIIDVTNVNDLLHNFRKLKKIKGATAVLIQEMVNGKEIFTGAKREAGFPPLILCGAGGIYVEALKDSESSLSPITRKDAVEMVSKLRIKPILDGMRAEAPCNLEALYDTLQKVSELMESMPEIAELDINPLMLNEDTAIAVDARIKIEKQDENTL